MRWWMRRGACRPFLLCAAAETTSLVMEGASAEHIVALGRGRHSPCLSQQGPGDMSDEGLRLRDCRVKPGLSVPRLTSGARPTGAAPGGRCPPGNELRLPSSVQEQFANWSRFALRCEGRAVGGCGRLCLVGFGGFYYFSLRSTGCAGTAGLPRPVASTQLGVAAPEVFSLHSGFV